MTKPSAAPTVTEKPALRVEVTEQAGYEAELAAATRQILGDPEVNREFPGGDLWMVGFDVAGKGDDHRFFSAIVADMASGRQMEVRGDLDEPENWWLRHIAGQRLPSDDEFAWAKGVLAEHHRTAAGEEPYRPMPPLGPLNRPDGSAERIVAVGLRTPDGSHRIVGVRGIDGEVVDELTAALPASSAEWGLPVGESSPGTAGANHARVRVWLADDVPLWDLVVVRPSASSGLNGSGLELRAVDYQGRRVLHRAHLPILNLAVGGATGSDGGGDSLWYRSWLNQESGFVAEGTDPVPGFRLCDQAPTTALDGESGGGPFQGVAIWVDGAELVVVSQMQAGWYRYVGEWRLSAEGTIRPRFGVAVTTNPGAAVAHVHNAYWRLDFDILGDIENLAQEYNDPPVIGEGSWHTINHEVHRPRDEASARYWRVRNVRSAATYSIVPDAGNGDVWILRFHDDEIDDGQGFTTDPVLARTHLDRLVSGEPLRREDIVVWYSGSVVLDPATGNPASVPIGPDLVPGHWVRAESNDVFGHVDSTDSYRP